MSNRNIKHTALLCAQWVIPPLPDGCRRRCLEQTTIVNNLSRFTQATASNEQPARRQLAAVMRFARRLIAQHYRVIRFCSVTQSFVFRSDRDVETWNYHNINHNILLATRRIMKINMNPTSSWPIGQLWLMLHYYGIMQCVFIRPEITRIYCTDKITRTDVGTPEKRITFN